MTSGLCVASPPSKPLLVYDGDCGFCRFWVRRWKQMTGERVDCLPAQDARVPAEFPEIPRERFALTVQLVETDGRVFSGAEAILRAMSYGPSRGWPLRAYQSVPVFAKSAERTYRFVADHRLFLSRLTRLLWRRHIEHSCVPPPLACGPSGRSPSASGQGRKQ
jgi:predicted DCC family thiol-disulfide oxidoreductase YuxK